MSTTSTIQLILYIVGNEMVLHHILLLFRLAQTWKISCEFLRLYAYYYTAHCTHCASASAVARSYCHFDAIKIERTTKTRVIGMENCGGKGRRVADGEEDCEIVPGKLACEPNTGSLKGVAYCLLWTGQNSYAHRMQCTHVYVRTSHTLSFPRCRIPSLRHICFPLPNIFDWHFVKQYH